MRSRSLLWFRVNSLISSLRTRWRRRRGGSRHLARTQQVVGLVDLLQLLLRLFLQARVVLKPVRMPNLGKVPMRCFQFPHWNAGLHSQQFVGLVQVCAQLFSSKTGRLPVSKLFAAARWQWVLALPCSA